MKKIITAWLFVCVCILVSCSDSTKETTSENESCMNPIKDPNNPKPMAFNSGEVVDSVTYPLMSFWTVEPTDSTVLEPLFFNNAKQFAAAYRQLMSDVNHQKENYTAVINACVHCHSSYCSGPLKRISKLTLEYKAE
jgi:cytochrome c553